MRHIKISNVVKIEAEISARAYKKLCEKLKGYNKQGLWKIMDHYIFHTMQDHHVEELLKILDTFEKTKSFEEPPAPVEGAVEDSSPITDKLKKQGMLGNRYPKSKKKLSDNDIAKLDKLFHSLNRMSRYTDDWRTTCEEINKILGYEVVANDEIASKSVGYSSHGTITTLQDIYEAEVEERGNDWFDDSDLDRNKTKAIWVTHKPEDALRYAVSDEDAAEYKDNPLDYVTSVPLIGFTPVLEDGDGGFLYIKPVKKIVIAAVEDMEVPMPERRMEFTTPITAEDLENSKTKLDILYDVNYFTYLAPETAQANAKKLISYAESIDYPTPAHWHLIAVSADLLTGDED